MLTNYDIINTIFGKLNYNDIILFEDKIYRIVEKFHSKPGKHGAAKVKIICLNYFNEEKKEIITMPSAANVNKILFIPGIGIISKIYKQEQQEGIDLFLKELKKYEKDKNINYNLKNKEILEITVFFPEMQQTYFISTNTDIFNQEGLEVKYILTEYGRKIVSLR